MGQGRTRPAWLGALGQPFTPLAQVPHWSGAGTSLVAQKEFSCKSPRNKAKGCVREGCGMPSATAGAVPPDSAAMFTADKTQSTVGSTLHSTYEAMGGRLRVYVHCGHYLR